MSVCGFLHTGAGLYGMRNHRDIAELDVPTGPRNSPA